MASGDQAPFGGAGEGVDTAHMTLVSEDTRRGYTVTQRAMCWLRDTGSRTRSVLSWATPRTLSDDSHDLCQRQWEQAVPDSKGSQQSHSTSLLPSVVNEFWRLFSLSSPGFISR